MKLISADIEPEEKVWDFFEMLCSSITFPTIRSLSLNDFYNMSLRGI